MGEPYFADQRALRRAIAADGRVTGFVEVRLDEVIKWDLQGLLDHLSDRLVGSKDLEEVGFYLVDTKPDNILIFEVSGDPTGCLEV